jgi:uncharacterized repeat protein (TIGR04138 family)
MQKLEFGEALDLILKQDPRYHPDAYHFLRDGLDYTLKLRKRAKESTGHVSGQQLLEGIRQYALKQFGPMVPTVFEYWGVKCGEDFGQMVFNLINVGIFGRSETDSMEDFKGGYSFHNAFVVPFLPAKTASQGRRNAARPVERLS